MCQALHGGTVLTVRTPVWSLPWGVPLLRKPVTQLCLLMSSLGSCLSKKFHTILCGRWGAATRPAVPRTGCHEGHGKRDGGNLWTSQGT